MTNINKKFDNAFGSVIGSFYDTLPTLKKLDTTNRNRLIPEPHSAKTEIIQKNDIKNDKSSKNFLYYVKKLFNKRK